MKNIKIEVYHLFFAITVIVLLIGIIQKDNTLDINIHDTYFVISNLIVSYAICLFYILNGLGYWLLIKIMKKKLVKALTIIHLIVFIGGFIIYWIIIAYSAFRVNNGPHNFYDYQLQSVFSAAMAFLIIFVAGPAYIINLLIGIFRKR
ncbi:MAG: hypothetical protein EOO44_02740 [Flavobacterium sp.]|nr:MAG: hypothetical protein EOO44_02740 [Flavobacterium sp.]